MVYSNDSLLVSVSFYNRSDDSLINRVQGLSGERFSVLWSDLSYNTTYWWYVVVLDPYSRIKTTSDVFKFKTINEGASSNNAPYKPTDPNPINNKINVDLNATLSVFVSDPDGDDLSINFYDADSDTLVGSASAISGTRCSIIWYNLDPETQYSWYATVSDSEYSNTSNIFTFTTKTSEKTVNNPPNSPDNPNPKNDASGVSINPALSVDISDPDDDTLTAYFYNAENHSLIGSVSAQSNSRVSVVWPGLEYETAYSWYVSVSDSNYSTNSSIFSFKTKNKTTTEKNSPYKPLSPVPYNGAIDVEINASLNIFVFDPDGDDLTVSFYNASDDSLIGTKSVKSGDTASVIWSNLDYGTTYTWYVKVNDSEFENTSEVFSFTTKNKHIDAEEYGWIIGIVEIKYNDSIIPATKAKICIYQENSTTPLNCVTSDEYGVFLLPKIKPGSYAVQATREKWSSNKSLISVNKNQSKYISLRIPVDKNRYNVEKAIEKGDIGGELMIEQKEKNVYDHELVIYKNISMTPVELSKGYISILLNGDEKTLGKTIVITVDKYLFGNSNEIIVEYDGDAISMADDVNDIFNPNDDGSHAEYLITKGSQATQILISIPHFSQHEIKIYNAAEALERSYNKNTVLMYFLSCAILSIIILSVLYVTGRW